MAGALSPEPLHLVKMHGLGNDYVYIDAVGGPGLGDDVDLSRLAVQLSDRHFGVGGDGLIIISRAPSGRLAMRMFNADGSEGEMCGNGVRCLAAYAYEQGYTDGPRIEVETRAGLIVPEVTPGPGSERRAVSVTVDMGPPREVRPGLELNVPAGPAASGSPPAPRSPGVRGAGRPGDVYSGTYVSMGNPHFVVLVPDVSQVDLPRVGPVLETHPVFPNRANIEFVQVLSPERLRMRVWERGSGITLACATGASATLVAAVTAGACRSRAKVVLDGGELEVEWTGDGPVVVTGPTEEVFRTTWSKPLPRLGPAQP